MVNLGFQFKEGLNGCGWGQILSRKGYRFCLMRGGGGGSRWSRGQVSDVQEYVPLNKPERENIKIYGSHALPLCVLYGPRSATTEKSIKHHLIIIFLGEYRTRVLTSASETIASLICCKAGGRGEGEEMGKEGCGKILSYLCIYTISISIFSRLFCFPQESIEVR